jgi:glucokinase
MYLGIEIGGTKLQLGVGRGDGSSLVECCRHDVDIRLGADGILAQIKETGSRLIDRYDVARIGIGFGGPVNSADTRVIKSHQVEGWNNFPLGEWCRKSFERPAVIANDCNVAALAEARFGAGRNARRLFFVTVGTGIGGGLVIDGELVGTERPAVAEIGHLRPGLDADQPELTIEATSSGQGIERTVQAELTNRQQRHPEDADRHDLLTRCGSRPQQISAKIIAEAAGDGNQLALGVLQHAWETLGWGLAQVVTLLAPEVIAVGGGVSLIGEALFFQPLRQQVCRYVFPPLRESYSLVSAELGELVVVQGALALAAES